MVNFTFYREPRPEQRRGFEISKDAEFFALFYDPRVGKTKVILDTFRYNYERGRVDAMVVIAYPSDVHLVWRDEAPKDLPPEFLEKTKLLCWRPGKMGTKAAQAELDALVPHPGPVIFTMNCEAIITPLGYRFLQRLFSRRRVLLVVDEDWSTNWSARTRRLLAMGRAKNTVMRRLLTGTPAEESPDDLYFPCSFLKPGSLGFGTATAFRARYTRYEEEEVTPGVFARKKGFNRRTGTTFDIKVGYQNLDELAERLSKFSDRVRRQGSNKVYAPRYFTLTDKQRSVYDKLRDEYVAELGDGPVPVAHVLTRMTRLQMVCRNYYPPEKIGTPCNACFNSGFLDDGSECERCAGLGMTVRTTDLQRIDARNPAQEALEYELRFSHRPFVVWARFIQDVEDALDAAIRVYPGRVARYDGTLSAEEREAAYHDFRAGKLDGLVATERSGLSRGHELTRAKLTVYYSNEFSARARRQSEDRTESMDKDAWTDVVDLVAADTRDLDVIEALRQKRSIAELVVGDPPSKWL